MHFWLLRSALPVFLFISISASDRFFYRHHLVSIDVECKPSSRGVHSLVSQPVMGFDFHDLLCVASVRATFANSRVGLLQGSPKRRCRASRYNSGGLRPGRQALVTIDSVFLSWCNSFSAPVRLATMRTIQRQGSLQGEHSPLEVLTAIGPTL